MLSWNLERQNPTSSVYALFIYFFLRFTIFLLLKSNHLWYLNFSEIDLFKFIEISLYEWPIFIHKSIYTENFFKSLQISEFFRKEQVGKKIIKINCQTNIRIQKISRIESFLNCENIKNRNFSNFENHNDD